jgi:hypothetical protein
MESEGFAIGDKNEQYKDKEIELKPLIKNRKEKNFH